MRTLVQESLKRGHNNKRAPCGPHAFDWFLHPLLAKWSQESSESTVRGRGGPTITIITILITFNNNNHLTQGPPCFLPTRRCSRRGFLPPFRVGNSSSKESPVLPIPTYSALCPEDTTSWNDRRPRTHQQRE